VVLALKSVLVIDDQFLRLTTIDSRKRIYRHAIHARPVMNTKISRKKRVLQPSDGADDITARYIEYCSWRGVALVFLRRLPQTWHIRRRLRHCMYSYWTRADSHCSPKVISSHILDDHDDRSCTRCLILASVPPAPRSWSPDETIVTQEAEMRSAWLYIRAASTTKLESGRYNTYS